MLTLIAFLVALAVLIAVHEWGHYRMAVACGVKVLRFSIGFGKTIARFKPKKQRPGQDTEFVIGIVPLGGYVKMLDEREAPAPEGERHLAFDNQPLRSRALIVAAGPVANLALAVLLYAAVNWIGVLEPRAILSAPLAGSLAEQAGLRGGETVRRAALGGDALEPVASFDDLRWILMSGALDRKNVALEVARAPDGAVSRVTLPTASLPTYDPQQLKNLLPAIGIVSPLSVPVIGHLVPGGPAERAGLQPGDRVLRVDGAPVNDGQQLVDLIRASGAHGEPAAAAWRIERAGRALTLQVRPDRREDQGQHIGRIDAEVGSAPEMVTVRRGPLAGLWAGAQRTWEMSALSVRLIGRMLTGQISLRNLSSPIAIAVYAGRAAALGLPRYLEFLAFISVSLGVLNLMPVPVLDGGQLMYYLWEAVTGKPVAGVWFERLQYLGMTLLLIMMAIAVFNDLANRLLI